MSKLHKNAIQQEQEAHSMIMAGVVKEDFRHLPAFFEVVGHSICTTTVESTLSKAKKYFDGIVAKGVPCQLVKNAGGRRRVIYSFQQ